MRAPAVVRNPLLKLDSAKRIAALPEDAKLALRILLYDLSKEARSFGTESWARNKPWTAVYWRCVSIYAKHIARLIA